MRTRGAGGDGGRAGHGTREVELKFGVAGPLSFEALLAVLGECPRASLGECPPARAVRQVNHFFDTDGFDLSRRGIALRLREEAGRFVLCAKGERPGAPAGPLTIRGEEELEVAAALAGPVLCGTQDVRALFPGADPGRDSLWERIRGLARDVELRRVGAFENERRRVGPYRLEAGGDELEITFELDRTTLPDGRCDFEIEVELEESADAAAARRALEELLRAAGVEWKVVASKAARFFAALGLPGPAVRDETSACGRHGPRESRPWAG